MLERHPAIFTPADSVPNISSISLACRPEHCSEHGGPPRGAPVALVLIALVWPAFRWAQGCSYPKGVQRRECIVCVWLCLLQRNEIQRPKMSALFLAILNVLTSTRSSRCTS